METQKITVGSTVQVIAGSGIHNVAIGSVGTVKLNDGDGYCVVFPNVGATYMKNDEVKLLVGDCELAPTNQQLQELLKEAIKIIQGIGLADVLNDTALRSNLIDEGLEFNDRALRFATLEVKPNE